MFLFFLAAGQERKVWDCRYAIFPANLYIISNKKGLQQSAALSLLIGTKNYFSSTISIFEKLTLNSTRRFLVLPAAVLLSAIG